MTAEELVKGVWLDGCEHNRFFHCPDCMVVKARLYANQRAAEELEAFRQWWYEADLDADVEGWLNHRQAALRPGEKP